MDANDGKVELRRKTDTEIITSLLTDVSLLKVRLNKVVEVLIILQTWMDEVNGMTRIDQSLFDQLNNRVSTLEDTV